MEGKSAVECGWEFSAKLIGADMSTQVAKAYVDRIEEAIAQLEISINNHPYRGQDIKHFKGYVAEEWHAGTLNINAVAADSADRAHVLHSNEAGSVDIQLDSGKKYSVKVYSTDKGSAVAQASMDPETHTEIYKNQERLVADDQLRGAQAEAHRRALANQGTRPDVAKVYRETEKHLTSEVTNEDGVKSIKKDRADFEEIARDGKKGEFKAEDQGVTVSSTIKPEYIMKQAVKAGLSAAVVTMIMQTAPEIYKAIDYLIKTGELDLNQIKRSGTKAITSGAEGFLRGSIACTLQILCEKGVFGEVLKSIDPSCLGVAVTLTIETIKNSILVAAGKMEPREMGARLVDGVVVSTGFIVGTKIGAAIGGAIGQAIGFELPVVGYMLGSLIGCAFSAIYNIGKKKLISFCVDTGFTCFGLVDQNYQIPEDILRNMGIDITPILRVEVERVEIQRTEVPRIAFGNKTGLETIDLHVLRRGIIGVNKVGYVY